jgi:hypothetical protein
LEAIFAQATAVVLHELTTNAAKYGALSVPDGRIQIEWSSDSVGTGGPVVELPKSRGFGSKVMETMIRPRFCWHPQGLACEITLPLISSTPETLWRLAGGSGYSPRSFGIGADPGHHEQRSPSTSVPTDASG